MLYREIESKIKDHDASLAESTQGMYKDISLYPLEYLKNRQDFLLANLYKKLKTGVTAKLCVMGDSTMYGHDTVSSDKRPAMSDKTCDASVTTHTMTQASITVPEAMQEYCNTIFGVGMVTVVNRGFSGDYTERCLSRWTTPSNADLTIISYGINDATASWVGYKGDINSYLNYYERIISREILRNSAVVILTPIKQKFISTTDTFAVDSMTNSLYKLGEKYNVPVVNGAELLANYDVSIYSESYHLNGTGYRILGAKLMSLLIGAGVANPNCVQGGIKILTRPNLDNLFTNGTFSSNSNTNTPSEFTSGKGIAINLPPNKLVTYGFYADEDDLIASIIASTSGSTLSAKLDFGVEQPYRSFRNSPSDFTKDISDITLNEKTDFIRICKKGWHTITITNLGTTNTSVISGIEFFNNATFERVGNYIFQTHLDYNNTNEVATTRIRYEELIKCFNIKSVGSYWKSVPMKLKIYNYDQSILEYTFLLCSPNNNFGWGSFGLNNRINIATTPTERTLQNVSIDTSTKEIIFTWGGTTTRAANIVVTQ